METKATEIDILALEFNVVCSFNNYLSYSIERNSRKEKGKKQLKKTV